MKAHFNSVRNAALVLLAAMLVSCGGGSSAPPVALPGYYVDADSGSDLNTGRDPASAWKTLAQIAAAPVPADSTIYLKRGSVWYEQLTLANSSLTIDAYGDAVLPLPKIDGSKLVGSWTDEGGGIYSATVELEATEGLGNLSENGTMLAFVPWNTDATTTFASAAVGSYSYHNPDTLFIKRATAPSGTYRASVKFFGITATSLSDIIVKNVEIRRFSLHGIGFKDCVRCEVHGAVVAQGGGATIAGLNAGNGIEFGNSSTDGVVADTAVSEIFDSCVSPQTYDSSKSMSAISIRNSSMDRCGFAGVEVSVLSNGGSTGSSISGVSLSGLTITDAGKGWSGRRYGSEGNGVRIMADPGAGTISNVQIDTTTISGSAGNGVSLAGESGTVTLHRMHIKNNAIDGIALAETAATTLKLRLTSSLVHDNAQFGIAYNSPTAAGFELYQNTFSNNTVSNLFVLHQGNLARIQNNLFNTASAHLYTSSALAGAVVDNNCYNETTGTIISYSGSLFSTVTAFHAAISAFEGGGAGGAVGLADAGAGNFALLGSSACKALGNPSAGVTTDYSGYPLANPPSSGAYQYH